MSETGHESGRKNRLNAILFIAFIFALIVAISYYAWNNHKNYENYVISQNLMMMKNASETVSMILKGFVDEHTEQLLILSKDPGFQKEIFYSGIIYDEETHLCPLRILYDVNIGDVSAVYAFDSKGILLDTHPINLERIGSNYSDSQEFKYVLKNNEPFTSKLFKSESGQITISITVPVLDNGQFIGALRWDVESHLIFENFLKHNYHEGEEVWLLDEDGKVISHPEAYHLGNNYLEIHRQKYPNVNWDDLEKAMEKIAKRESGVTQINYHESYYKFANPQRELLAYSTVNVNNSFWTVGVTKKYKDITEPITQHEKDTYGLAGLFLLFIIVGGLTLYKTQKKKAILEAQTENLQLIADSEEKYRKLFENNSYGVGIATKSGKVLIQNDAMRDLSGYSMEDWSRISVADTYVNKEVRNEMFKILERDNKVENFEMQLKNKQNETYWATFSIKPIIYEGQDALLTTAVDITERKNAEELLKQQYKQLHILNDVTSNVSESIDLEKGLKTILDKALESVDASVGMIFLSNIIEKTLSFAADIGLSDAFVNEYKQRDISFGEGLTGRIAATGDPIFIKNKSSHDSRIARKIVVDEDLNSFIGIPLMSKNEVIGVMNILTRSEKDLNESDVEILSVIGNGVGAAIEKARLYEDLHKSADELKIRNQIANIFLTIPDKKIYSEVLKIVLDISKSKYGGFGYLDDDLNLVVPSLTYDIWDVCKMRDKDSIFPLDQMQDTIFGKAVIEKKSMFSNNPFKVPDGHIQIKRALDVPIIYQKKVIGNFIVGNKESDYTDVDKDYLNTIADIVAPILSARLQGEKQKEEQKILEEQLFQAQKMESIGRLAGGIAHDFNNILTGIMGYAELLMVKHSDTSSPEGTAADVIFRGAVRAADLTNQLLGFARKGKYNPIAINVNSIIKDTVKVSEKIFEKNIEVIYELDDNIHIIEADKNQLYQVFTNLIINAKDAMPDGGQLTFKTENVLINDEDIKLMKGLRAGPFVKVSLKDTGIGVPDEIKEKIFEPFYTTKGEGKGTGLGLATVYGIIKNHDGHIYCESESGKGSSFIIYFQAFNKKVEEIDDDKEIIKGDATILFVDDEEDVRSTVENMLKSIGYKVLLAEDGEEAIKIYKNEQNEIDIILLDMVMPKMAGKETYIELKKINSDVKMILVSGYSQESKAAEILKNGALDFVQKPFNMKELSKTLNQVLKE